MVRHLISILDVKENIMDIIETGLQLKKKLGEGGGHRPMEGKSLGMIFEKSSTRTRVSFEVGAFQLGAAALYLNKNDLQLGRGETISDTGKVLSRYVDMIVYRAFDHGNVAELAKSSSVPVINALDDREHPCQALADLMTIYEKKVSFEEIKLAYVGDGNNVCNSLLLAAAAVGLDISAATPSGLAPDPEIVGSAMEIAKKSGARVELLTDPRKAVSGADVIYTDVWISMGQKERDGKRKALIPYRVNRDLTGEADDDYIFMHCLPAHRGEEVTDEIMDSRHSVVFDQAENRLHVQKAIMLHLLGKV